MHYDERCNTYLFLICMKSYALIGIDEITPIWTETRMEKEGLNFTAANVATMMILAAPAGLFSNLLLVPWMIKRLV